MISCEEENMACIDATHKVRVSQIKEGTILGGTKGLEMKHNVIHIEEKEKCMHQNLLHQICSSEPTLPHVLELAVSCKEQIEQLNHLGQTPLHVAAEKSASASVIEHLLSLYPDAAKVQDVRGKTPLMYLCNHKILTNDAQKNKSEVSVLVNAVRLLCDVAPSCVGLEDKDGMSAIEYAIQNNIRSDVLEVLMRTQLLGFDLRDKLGQCEEAITDGSLFGSFTSEAEESESEEHLFSLSADSDHINRRQSLFGSFTQSAGDELGVWSFADE